MSLLLHPDLSFRFAENYIGAVNKVALQGYKRSAVCITGPLQQRMIALKLQAEHVMAGMIGSLSDAVAATPEHLTTAIRGVFTECPTALRWCQCPDATGCWVAQCSRPRPAVYTVNLLTGAAMLNGHAPSHLPDAIVGHEVYHKVFHSAVFDVTPTVDGDQVTYCTAGAVNGCTYTWHRIQDRLIVTETCRGATLELLPCASPCDAKLRKCCFGAFCVGLS